MTHGLVRQVFEAADGHGEYGSVRGDAALLPPVDTSIELIVEAIRTPR